MARGVTHENRDPGPVRTGVTVALRQVSKSFPGQTARALSDVDLDLEAGKVRGLVGQNGSGKSTLIKIMAGFHRPDPGAEAWVDGEDFELGSAAAAERAGMRFIHQDLGLVPSLSAVDNLALGHGYKSAGFVRMRREVKAAKLLLADFGFEFDLGVPVGQLRPIERSGLAIVRALRSRSELDGLRVLVLDEPTESLGRREVGRLFEAVRRVSAEGAAILYVTHKLDEMLQIADDVSALRDGRLVATHPASELDHDKLVELIIGRPSEVLDTIVSSGTGEVAFSASALAGGAVRNVSLHVNRGEVVGIAGVVGSGRDELPYLLGGARRATGDISLEGKLLPRLNSRTAMRSGIVFVASDRQSESAIPQLAVYENITLPKLQPRGPLRWLGVRREARSVQRWLDQFEIRPADPRRLLATLSGGNQQKAVLARALRCEPKVLIVDEPVQGVDVGAKLAIFRLIADAAAAGLAVLIASSDPDDLANVCHRVLVMRDGTVTAELSAGAKTPDHISETLLRSSQSLKQSE